MSIQNLYHLVVTRNWALVTRIYFLFVIRGFGSSGRWLWIRF